jgi:hypothetical protein
MSIRGLLGGAGSSVMVYLAQLSRSQIGRSSAPFQSARIGPSHPAAHRLIVRS